MVRRERGREGGRKRGKKRGREGGREGGKGGKERDRDIEGETERERECQTPSGYILGQWYENIIELKSCVVVTCTVQYTETYSIRTLTAVEQIYR